MTHQSKSTNAFTGSICHVNCRSMSKLKKIEAFYQKDFKKVIQEEHHEKKRSILSISKECSVSRDSIYNYCKLLNIKTRTSSEQSIASYKAGRVHPLLGLTKETNERLLRQSNLMKIKNPSRLISVRTKAAKKRALYFKENPLPQELFTIEILKQIGVDFIFQHPFGPYVLDFYLPSKKICIEVDSTDKWDKKRRANAQKKDSYLAKNKIIVLRINKKNLSIETVNQLLSKYI